MGTSGKQQDASAASDADTLWTVTDVAGWAQVSKSWVYQAAASGRIPTLKIGGMLRFDPAAVKKFFLSGANTGRKVIPINTKSASKGGERE